MHSMVALLFVLGCHVLRGDADNDGHVSPSRGGDDCDDDDPTINPSATDIPYDGINSDCGPTSDYDADRDGHESADFNGDDCDDQDPLVSPTATDVPYDGIDQDCDGVDLAWRSVSAGVF